MAHFLIAILCYEYLLTTTREVDFFWMKPQRSWMFVLFVANRYITLLGRIPAMVSAFWPRSWGEDGTVCDYETFAFREPLIPCISCQ
ncbi:hypothetical protein EDC04DRAFT_2566141 [Pisolithus marmoratus]|nr:hypothetical protein EDC04DRAFT_2566141 [Pisolithus marmoratus]